MHYFFQLEDESPNIILFVKILIISIRSSILGLDDFVWDVQENSKKASHY